MVMLIHAVLKVFERLLKDKNIPIVIVIAPMMV